MNQFLTAKILIFLKQIIALVCDIENPKQTLDIEYPKQTLALVCDIQYPKQTLALVCDIEYPKQPLALVCDIEYSKACWNSEHLFVKFLCNAQ